MHYRVALWRTTTSPLPIATLLIEAEDTRQAAHAALIEHGAVSMGAVVVMNSAGQQTYFDAQLAGECITFSREAWSPRFPGVWHREVKRARPVFKAHDRRNPTK